ncbi:MAG: hypothetical protein PHF12_01670 [Candidatus Omnitrophica bacterium]|nr:hypothetical protein [Candidatus Omnitrophota bacterium]
MNRNAGVKGASCGISVGAQCVIGIPKKVLDGHGLLGQIDLDCLGGRFAMVCHPIFVDNKDKIFTINYKYEIVTLRERIGQDPIQV